MINYKFVNNGFNPELIKKAVLVGKYDMPLIKKQEVDDIEKFIPFDKRNLYKNCNAIVHFYIYDGSFKQIINNPEKYKNELNKYKAVISPDFSIYYDTPIIEQIYNTFLNRLIGSYYQNNGIKVIPNVRWGDSRSYEFCFEGLESEGIYSVGSYGQIKKRENLYYFEKGLAEFFNRLKPKKVYVYGAMPESIFGKYKKDSELIAIEPYTSKIYRGAI